jgi:hypothetical protein
MMMAKNLRLVINEKYSTDEILPPAKFPCVEMFRWNIANKTVIIGIFNHITDYRIIDRPTSDDYMGIHAYN